ncbi:SMP-30/gluconolactonase/LRE family protein [Ramlibacter sp.]|uniref:SMP-30/gluconolactonase/LRE family protein n=1 Tax=Ramlibacter sp. TaxID=1917967 RepID=UPI003D111B3E
METTIRRIGSSKDLLGESPCWDARSAAVWWIDSLSGVVRRLAVGPDEGGEQIHRVPAPVGSMALCEGSGILLALKDRFALFDPATGAIEDLARIDVDHPDVRLNDGKCDPWGNFIAGTLQVHRAPGEAAKGGLYRLAPDGGLEVLARGYGLTNGPCFSPDGRTLYVADSSLGVRTIRAYDYAPDRPLSGERVFAQTESLGAGPDGAAVDEQGFLWSALPRIGQLARFAPDGRLERLVKMPATHPTSLCFGGPDLDRLYVTSISRSTNLTGTLPDDGGLWEVRGLPARGVPVSRFDR